MFLMRHIRIFSVPRYYSSLSYSLFQRFMKCQLSDFFFSSPNTPTVTDSPREKSRRERIVIENSSWVPLDCLSVFRVSLWCLMFFVQDTERERRLVSQSDPCNWGRREWNNTRKRTRELYRCSRNHSLSNGFFSPFTFAFSSRQFRYDCC